MVNFPTNSFMTEQIAKGVEKILGMRPPKLVITVSTDGDEVIWNLPRARQLQEEIWEYNCPQCWTPCEANQSILGNLMRGSV